MARNSRPQAPKTRNKTRRVNMGASQRGERYTRNKTWKRDLSF